MNNIFVYGSLMFDDIWNRIVKRRYQKKPAVLHGYKRLAVRGKNYPGLIKSVHSSVPGFIYFNVTARDIRRLDKFEGGNYKKIPVTVICDDTLKYRAKAYLFIRRKINLLAHKSWDPACFMNHHLDSFIAGHRRHG